MHTSLEPWQIAVALSIVVFVLMWFGGAFRLPGTPITICCTRCNHTKTLHWDEKTQNFDIRPLDLWIFHRDFGWRCERCGDGPPQHYPDLYPKDPLPSDDVH